MSLYAAPLQLFHFHISPSHTLKDWNIKCMVSCQVKMVDAIQVNTIRDDAEEHSENACRSF